LAGRAGATFISPFVGRLDDISQDGMQLIADIVTIYRNYPSIKTEVLVASVRHPMHVVEAAKLGAQVCTLPPAVLRALAKHPLTELVHLNHANQATQSQVHAAVLALVEADSFAQLIETVTHGFPRLLDVDVVTICVEKGDSGPRDVRTDGVHMIASGRVNALLG